MYALQSFKGWLYSSSLLSLQTFEVFQGSYSSPILNHAFEFWLTDKYFEPPWKSGPAKTRSGRPVPPPLLYSRKVWWGWNMANLVNYHWFTKLKSPKLEDLVSNLWQIYSFAKLICHNYHSCTFSELLPNIITAKLSHHIRYSSTVI